MTTLTPICIPAEKMPDETWAAYEQSFINLPEGLLKTALKHIAWEKADKHRSFEQEEANFQLREKQRATAERAIA